MHIQIHPTNSSKYWFFSQCMSQAIWDCKSQTYITLAMCQEVNFIITVLSDPTTYKWEPPIAHLIPREHNYKAYQDTCPQGTSGFSTSLDFWWTLPWPSKVTPWAFLPTMDPAYISNNILEYAAISLGVSPCSLMTKHSLSHAPVDGQHSSKSMDKWIAGLKTPQGCSLAWLFLHLLPMFLEISIHIPGDDNIIANYLSCIAITHTSSSFTYLHLQTHFPWLKLSCLFQLSNELLVFIYTALSKPSINIPTTRVQLRQITAESVTSSQHFFGMWGLKTPSSSPSPYKKCS